MDRDAHRQATSNASQAMSLPATPDKAGACRGTAGPAPVKEEVMYVKAKLLAVLAAAALACGTTACGSAGATPQQAPSRPAPARSAPAVAFCVAGGYPAYQHCGIEPAQIYFSGDNSVSIREITWSSWQASGAAGRGTWYLQTCNPDCDQGPVIKYPGTLTLSAARHGLFTVLAVIMKGETTIYRYPVPWPQFARGCRHSPMCDQAAGPGSSR
jgi:hypothetical protein